jgi:hypothetical protein
VPARQVAVSFSGERGATDASGFVDDDLIPLREWHGDHV